MSKLDEKEIIKIFQNELKNKKFISEDVEVFGIGGKTMVSKIDTLVESTDVPPKTKLRYAARKSIVACVSDFASKGVKPKFGIISLVLPKNLTKLNIQEIAKALGNASREFDFKILGGDTNAGKEIVIQVCLFGFTKKIVRRSGAKIGDLIFVTGPFGYTAAGLKILLRKKKTNSAFSKKAKSFFLSPLPRIKFGLACRNFLSSAMDSSDGLSITLNEMACQSKNKFVINRIPSHQDLFEFSKANKMKYEDLVFEGGEEYEIVFTASPKNRSKIFQKAKQSKTPIIEIGYVTKGNGVFLQTISGKIVLRDKGWLHFTS